MSKFRRSKKEAAQIPLKAVEWAVYHLDKFARSKEHEDIDSKVSGSRACCGVTCSKEHEDIDSKVSGSRACCGSRAPLSATSASFKSSSD